MKFSSVLLSLFVICGQGRAQTCKKDFSDGLSGLDPYGFLTIYPYTHVIVRSGGHTIEYILRRGFVVNIYIDGKEAQVSPDQSVPITQADVNNQIASICGPNFLPLPSGSASVPSNTSFTTANTTSATQVADLTAGHTSGDIVIADFNGDGVTDSATLAGRGIFITLRGDPAAASLSALYPVTGIGVAQNIVVADFNGDGVPDLAVTQGTFSTSLNPFPPGNVVVLLGKGDGTFGPPVTFPAGPVGNSYLATGDFNGDGVIDLALTHSIAKGMGAVAVLLGKGDGTFGSAFDFAVGPRPFTLLAADFNRDGKLDLAALDAFNSANKIWVLQGRGDGTFQPAVSSPSATSEGFLAYADLNHDGKLDLIIADQPASAMEVLFGNGEGTFQAGKEYLLSAHPTSIGVVPLQDGNTSLFTADNISSNLFLFFVTGDGAVHSPELQTIGSSTSAIATADLNGDGQPDLVITDPSAGKIYVKLSTGKGQFASPVSYAAGSPSPLAIADLNGDGKPDVIAGDFTGLKVLLGKGDGTLATVNTFPFLGSLSSVAVADFNLDGKPDVAATSAAAGGSVALFLGDGRGAFQPPRALPLPNAQAAVSGDFNSDGKPDLIVTNGPVDFNTPGNLQVLLGNGDGTFQSSPNIALPGPLFSTALAVGDVNGDGRLDVVTTVFGGNRSRIVVLLGNGDGTFQPPSAINVATAPPMIAIADLDGDGKADLLLADCCGLTEASFMLGNGDGTFQPESQFPSGPNPQGIAIADFNGDGKPDLAIIGQIMEANPRRGTLAVLFNAFGKAAASVGSTANPPLVPSLK